MSLCESVPENQDVAPTLSPMRDVIVNEGSAAQFRTQVSGSPSPTVQWFREGILIPATPDFKVSLNIGLEIHTKVDIDTSLLVNIKKKKKNYHIIRIKQ